MNPTKLITLAALILLSTLYSCEPPINSKESYLKEYRAFIDEIKEDKDTYSEEEWKEKDKEFKKFSEELYGQYESELGWSEQLRVGKYAVVYGTSRGASALGDAIKEGGGILGEISEIFDEDLENDLNEVIGDLKQVWDEDLRGEIEDKLEKVKEQLEDEEFQGDIKAKIEEIKDIVKDKDLQGKVKEVLKDLEDVFEEIEEKAKE